MASHYVIDSAGFTGKKRMITIGVLALQGAFIEHVHSFMRLQRSKEARNSSGAAETEPLLRVVEVRTAEPLRDGSVDALVIPGGESTTIAIVAARSGVLEPLREWVHSGKPVWGTCAGLIMLADEVLDTKEGGQAVLGGLPVSVRRNAFGAQADSFAAPVPFPSSLLPTQKSSQKDEEPFMGIFIRAPVIEKVAPDSGVEILAKFDDKIVAVRKGPILGTAFHPELDPNDQRWHQYFYEMVRELKQMK